MTSPTGHAAALKTKALAEQYNVRTAVSFSDPGMVKFFGTIWPMVEGVSSSFSVMRQGDGVGAMRSSGRAIDAIKAVARRFVITLGAQGAVTWDGENLHRVAAKPVEAVKPMAPETCSRAHFSTRFQRRAIQGDRIATLAAGGSKILRSAFGQDAV